MGLDMYAYTAKKRIEDVPLFFDEDYSDKYLEYVYDEFWYWRKHPNLHGWFQELYLERGGVDDFNCVWIELREQDLDRLEKDIKEGKLPFTQGFFFGKSNEDELQKENDLKFVEEARRQIEDGFVVYYKSWW